MEIDQLVEQFGQDSGLRNLKLNQDGLCRLVFDDKLFVDIEKTSSNFVLHSVVGKPPIQQDEQLEYMEMLLQANGPDHAIGDIHLGFDIKMDEVLIFQNFANVDVNFDYFKKCMEEFISQVGKWRSRLSAAVGMEMDTLNPSKPDKEAAEEKKEAKEAPASKISDSSDIPPGMITP